MNAERLELLARIAGYYWEDGLTQADIASRLGYTPSMISRLLSEARQQGVVEIRIRHPLARRSDLERELQEKLDLKLVRVAAYEELDDTQMLRRLGALAAGLMEELVHDGMTIGVAWGPAVYETVSSLRPGISSGVHVVQLMGAAGALDSQYFSPDIARRLARTLTGFYTPLPVPHFVDSEATRDSLLRDPQIHAVVEQFKAIDLALTGVGTLDPERSSLVRAGYLTDVQLMELEQYGAVGEICGVSFDLYGNVLDVPLTRRIVGIDALTLAAVPVKLAIAGGHHKVLPIIGAGRAKLIDILVTDEIAAQGAARILRRMGASDSGDRLIQPPDDSPPGRNGTGPWAAAQYS